jgi:hypothetical protein
MEAFLLGWVIAILIGAVVAILASTKANNGRFWGAIIFGSTALLGLLGLSISIILLFLFADTDNSSRPEPIDRY